MPATDLIQQRRPSFRAPPQGRPFSPSAACSSLVVRGRTPLRRRLRWRSGAALLPLRPAASGAPPLRCSAAVRATLLLSVLLCSCPCCSAAVPICSPPLWLYCCPCCSAAVPNCSPLCCSAAVRAALLRCPWGFDVLSAGRIQISSV